MKRVGIVTWYGANCTRFNFGTCLQSYALQKALRDLGYDARMMSFSSTGFRYFIKKLLDVLGLLGFVRLFIRLIKNREIIDLNYDRRIRKWNSRYYCEFHVGSPELLRREMRRLDCIVSGSDQIWNTYHEFNPRMFLDFAGEVKRVSYASSIGTRMVNPLFSNAVKRLLSAFSHISMRESAGIVALKELTGRDDIRKVQDPTLLLTFDEWRRFAMGTSLHNKIPIKYVLCYHLANKDAYIAQIKDVTQALSVNRVVVVPSKENPNFDVPGAFRYEKATPSEFVRLIYQATVVCTDSFHAMALSILLGKPFVVFKRFNDDDVANQNSRIYELLSRYGLGCQMYDAINRAWVKQDVDYESVYKRLETDRSESLTYLKSIIED